ncbi:MAG: lysophospholipid acyltransferase family protein [Leptospiraceae bacterium]|nr:lysophospholipid acyltransferase family protein [Leptospiraceae bacterium]
MKRSFRKELLLAIASRAMRWLIQGIGRTCRVKIVVGEEVIEDLLNNRRPVIFCFWHNRIFFSAYYLYRHLFRKGIHLTVLISQSDDGELIARVVKLWGGTLARGSSTRGGKDALSILNKAIRKENSSIVTTPDGPKGPVYQFQLGTVIAAQFTGAEIVPICFDADKKWELKSWDKFIIPKPFSNVVVSFGKPVKLTRSKSEEEREESRLVIENIMRQQKDQVTSLLNAMG